jgi:hypothetical protein
MIRADDMGRKQNLRYSGRMGVGWSELKMFSLYSIIAASTASKHQTLASNGGVSQEPPVRPLPHYSEERWNSQRRVVLRVRWKPAAARTSAPWSVLTPVIYIKHVFGRHGVCRQQHEAQPKELALVLNKMCGLSHSKALRVNQDLFHTGASVCPAG